MATPADDGLLVHVVRVFCDDHGDHGNPLGVVMDGAAIPAPADRQALAAELGFSETVFVDDAAAAALRIFAPTEELPLAGHPLVGTSWLLRELGAPVGVLRPPAGEVRTEAAPGGAWIEADPQWAPAWTLRELPGPAAVDAADPAEYGPDAFVHVWSWIDRERGEVRARTFAQRVGLTEDEATGSAALRLVGLLGRAVRIRQGRGSVIDAAPAEAGFVRVGGRVVADPPVRVRFP